MKKVAPPPGQAAPALLVEVRWENGTSHPAHITRAGDLVLALLSETPDGALGAMSPPPRRRVAVSVSRRLTLNEVQSGVRGAVHGPKGTRYPGNGNLVSHVVALSSVGKGGPKAVELLCMRFEWEGGTPEERMVSLSEADVAMYAPELRRELEERAAQRWTSEAGGEARPFLEAFFMKAMANDKAVRERVSLAMGGGGYALGGEESVELEALRKVAAALEKAAST